jgi:hypothetical protein
MDPSQQCAHPLDPVQPGSGAHTLPTSADDETAVPPQVPVHIGYGVTFPDQVQAAGLRQDGGALEGMPAGHAVHVDAAADAHRPASDELMPDAEAQQSMAPADGAAAAEYGEAPMPDQEMTQVSAPAHDSGRGEAPQPMETNHAATESSQPAAAAQAQHYRASDHAELLAEDASADAAVVDASGASEQPIEVPGAQTGPDQVLEEPEGAVNFQQGGDVISGQVAAHTLGPQAALMADSQANGQAPGGAGHLGGRVGGTQELPGGHAGAPFEDSAATNASANAAAATPRVGILDQL